jgi:hypothetical protein
MAKQRSSSSSNSNRRTSGGRQARQNTSSIQTNSFVKGMNKDITPSLENNQSWWHARNVANNSEDGDLGIIGNEPSNLLCGVIPYTIIGAVHRYGDEWIVYSTDDESSEIGLFDDSECKYTTLINDPCLSFNRKYLITGAAKENFDCTWQVYWDDGNNPSRALNIDDIPWKKTQVSGVDIDGDPCVRFEIDEPKKLDCEQIRLAPLLNTPCVKLEKSIDGGLLSNGSYQVFIAYTENEQTVTDYIGVSNIQTLWSHEGTNSSLNISLSNLDEDYEYFELVLLRRNQGQTSAKRIGFYSTQQKAINIDFVDPALVSINLELIPLRSPAYEKSETMFVVNDWLLRQGPTEQFDFNYQPIANNIKVKWVINSQPSDYYSKGGNKFNFLRDEQYAFFIRWIYNTGERSSSYHIPGRSPESYTADNGNSYLENEIIFGDNVLNSEGDPLYKVYNTASILEQNIAEFLDDGTKIIARGNMGYWESTEKYPSNKPEIWGDLCGRPIRHHKMPDESIGGATSPLHLTSTIGDEINVLGVEFENIGRPKYNDGTYIENVVGYEVLRGSRLGAKSILGKGIFKNMRKYTVPNSENLIGGDVQGLYPNYPYNDLRPDVYFHDGNKADSLNRSNGCDSFKQSCETFRPLGDSPDVDGEPSGFSRKVFSFHSPDLMFTQPFLNASETKIYGQLDGNSSGFFKPSENHPQFKLLRGASALIASIMGLGYALHQVRGTSTQEQTSPYAHYDSAGAVGALIGVSSGPTTAPVLLPGYIIAGQAITNVTTTAQIALDVLYDTAFVLDDIYTGGTARYILEKIQTYAALNVAADPGIVGGQLNLQQSSDTSISNLPIFVKAITGLITSQTNIAIGGNEVIDLMYNMVSESDFGWKFNSYGLFSNFNNQTNGLWRIKNNSSNYIGSSFQTFDQGKYKINNLFRPTTVAVSLDKPINDPSVVDESRYVVGGDVNLFLNAQGEYAGSSVNEFSDSYLLNPGENRRTAISAHYGALKFNFDNQYGQLAGIRQVQMRGCVELLDPTKPNEFLYKSKPIFSGDTFIGRYTEKCIMPIFTNYLLGQPDGFTYDYSLYVNIPYPRFWLNSQKFDMTPLAGEIATFGFASESAVDAKFPNDLFYLDRGDDSCSSALSQVFGKAGDPNPSFAMKYAYMYTHVNGITDFFVESEINLEQRDYEDEPSKRFYSVYDYNDIDELFHAQIEKKDNFYKYDESLSPGKFPTQLGSFGEVQPLYYNPLVAETCFTKYPKRLIYSLQAQDEDRKDFWRVFLNFNYKDFKNDVSVIKPFSKNGALIFFPHLSPQLFQGIDTLKLGANNNVTIGDGKLFSQPFQNVANADISNEYGSCESIRGVINTPIGLFFISQQQGKIFQYSGKGLDPISNQGMKWWFNKYLPSRFIKQFSNSENSVWTDNPVHGVGCQVMYDSVDDVVYFMKKDYQLKPEFIAGATFTDRDIKPVEILTNQKIPIPIDIGNPIYFDDCSWTISYDPKVKAWISFHDWHPQLAIPSINHFFTTNATTVTDPQCPPGYNYNPTNGLCEIGINQTVPSTITVDNIASTTTGGASACLIDMVITVDVSGSTDNPTIPGDRAYAQLEWVKSFVGNADIQAALANGTMQIGFASWSGNAGTGFPPRTWNNPSNPGYTSNFSMEGTTLLTANGGVNHVDSYYLANWTGGGTDIPLGMQTGVTLASDVNQSEYASQYPARSNDPTYRRVIVTVTDTQGTPGSQCAFQSPNVSISGTGPTFQYMYAVFCGVNSPYPGGVANSAVMNQITCSNGPITIQAGTAGTSTSAYQYGVQSTISAAYPITNWDVVASELTANVCGTPFICECPAGYTKVFQNSTTTAYTESTGVCDDITPPICRKVTCACPPSTVPGSVVTETGTCPDTAPLIYQMVDADVSQADPRLCNYFSYEYVSPNFTVGGFWRHNYRCDSFVNFYNNDYPWEIDLISNTGQSVNTVRSFEYQLETYVYKGDPQYNMCGGDKWEDLDYNFDAAIVYNNDQTSGLLVLNNAAYNDPWGNLQYPSIGANNINIEVSKVEHKFRFNQFWDVTNDRGEFTNAEQSIFNTDCNGYIRPLNPINLNYQKSPTQRKKFRHYSNHVILRRNVSQNRKMLLRLNNTKLQLSMR